MPLPPTATITATARINTRVQGETSPANVPEVPQVIGSGGREPVVDNQNDNRRDDNSSPAVNERRKPVESTGQRNAVPNTRIGRTKMIQIK